MAHWIVSGRPDVDITGMNIDRLHPYQANPEYRATRTVESLGMVYATHYPGRSMRPPAAPGCRRCIDQLAARGAYFRDVSGWEGADWYAPEGSSRPDRAGRRRAVLGPAGLVPVLGGRASRPPARA